MRLINLLLLFALPFPSVADVEQHFSSIKHDPKALHDFFEQMPKSGELHYHLDGGAYPEAMIALARQGHYCMDKTSHHILDQSATQCADLNQLHKGTALYDETVSAWSMNEFIPGNETRPQHFFASFLKFAPIVANHAPELLVDVMKRAAHQHELYLEVMIYPDDGRSSDFGKLIQSSDSLTQQKNTLLNNAKFQDNVKNTLSSSSKMLTKAREILKCASASPDPACSLTIKFHYVIMRDQPITDFFAQALNGFATANQSQDLVAVNLVRAEDAPLSLQGYQQQMNILNFLHQAYPKVHISLHAGELVPWKVNNQPIAPKELTYHIQEAIFTGQAERIGHGLDIQYEENSEKLLKHMAEKPVPVEVNLTSNRQIFNVKEKHPIHTYWSHHVPVVLSTDDEGILRTTLTDEYVNAVVQQDLDYPTLKTINRNTLTYSFLPGKSLWENARLGRKVSECHDLHASLCLKFIAHSKKATLQWTLENQLNAFEAQYAEKH